MATRKPNSAALGSILFCLALAGLPWRAEAKKPPARVFRFAEDRIPASLDPAYATTMVETRLNELLFDGLFTFDAFLNPVPALAASFELSPDRRFMKVSLREAKWHDGKPVTPDDVVNTFRGLTSTESEAPARVGLLGIQDIRKVGPRDVQVIFKKPMLEPERALTFKILPAHLTGKPPFSPKNSLRSKPVGTGIYRHVSWDGANLEMKKTTPGGISRLMARFIPDKKVQLDFVQYDALEAVIRVLPKHRPVIEAMGDKINLLPYESLSWWYLGLNHQNPALQDVNVRRALVHALNRDELRRAHLGDGQTVTGPFAPRSPFYNSKVPAYRYSPAESAKLMAAAGYKKNKKGRFVKKGRPVKLRFVVNKDWSVYKDVCLDIQTQLSKAGFEVKLEWLDPVSWQKRVMKDKRFDLTISAWSFDEASDVFPLFFSQGSKNFISYQNARMDGLLKQSRQTQDPELFHEIYRRVHQLAHDDLPYVFLWSVHSYTAISTDVIHAEIHPFRYFTWIRDWAWKPSR